VAHYCQKRGGYAGPSLDSLALSAVHRAYSRTMHFIEAAAEFGKDPVKAYEGANE
jgi:hypothetical protein